jgi:signal transduction histidine kinase/CheY-like chemotaxis protein/ligand-binding sensor domain-containing protein
VSAIFLLVGLLLQTLEYIPSEAKSEYIIRHFTVNNGLPVNAINSIAQDDSGYLYFSTYNGLTRFDGYDFHVFDSGNTPELRTNRLAGILKTSDGTIWLFNEDGSITSKVGATFQTYTSRELPGRATWLVEDRQGTLWVGGTEGLAHFSRDNAQFIPFDRNLFSSQVNVITPGFENEHYFVNNQGLYRVVNQTLTQLLSQNDIDIRFEDILYLQLMENRQLWLIGTETAYLYRLSDGAVEQTLSRARSDLNLSATANKSTARHIMTTDSGYYVLGLHHSAVKKVDVPFDPATLELGLFLQGKYGETILVGKRHVIINNDVVLRGPEIKYVLLDTEGSLWVGTLSEGLYQIRKSSFINITQNDIHGFTNVYAIIETQDHSRWACSFTGGIFRITHQHVQNWTSDNSALSNNRCKSIFQDHDGTIYASLHDEGFWKLTEDDWIRLSGYDLLAENFQRSVEAMHRQQGRLLVSSFNSLMVFENNTFRYFDATQPRELSGIQVFVENTQGIIFAGTEGNGLIRIDGDVYQNYTVEHGGLNSNTIRDIFVQSDDTLWVVNESQGLNRVVLDDRGTLLSTASITVRDGLPQNSLHRIIDDQLGFFWISGNTGIMRVSRHELNAFADGATNELRVLSFNENDGMVNREANGGVQSAGILTTNGQLWFPNQRGITIINPAAFLTDYGLDVPAPVFESIVLHHGNMFIGKSREVTIPHHQRDFRVNFAVPNFVNQDRLMFTYRLEGVNEQWQDATQYRQAVFTGVPPGRYELTIRSQFIGSEPVESALIIVIPPRFHETRWFSFLVIMGILGVVYSGVRIRINSLKETERKLQERVDAQTGELQKAAEEKQRFFTGITHELKTPLSLIIGPLDDLIHNLDLRENEKIRDRLVLMQRNSSRLKNLVDQILDISKLNAEAISLRMQPVDLPLLTRRVAGQFQSRLEQEQVVVDIPETHFSESIYVDQEAWERIIINLMSNAIKFSPPLSTIRITCSEFETTVHVCICDEGIGIAREHHQNVFEYLYQVEGAKASEGTGIGLFLVRGLIEEMGGQVTLISDVGQGATFQLTLNKGYGHIANRHTVIHDETSIVHQQTDVVADTPVLPALHDSANHEHSILIVEDNYDFRAYLTAILEEHYEVLSAGNGITALELLGHETPDLIISDIMMPEMNGLDFIREVRTKSAFAHIPVIFLSARNADQDVQKGLSTGADIYLTKPIRSSILLSQIEAILRRERILQKGFQTPEVEQEPFFLSKVREIVYRQLGNPSLNVNLLADALYISRGKLYGDWKKVSTISVNDFIKQTRLNEAKVLLTEKGFSVQDAARAVGFSDANYFSTSFKKHFGSSPTEIR